MIKKALAKTDTSPGWFQNPTADHIVQFYNFENELIRSLYEYISSGLKTDDNCVIIATDAHIRKLTKLLSQDGMNISSLQLSGQLIILNAAHTLKKIIVNDQLDTGRFYAEVWDTIAARQRPGKPVRAYGEMVALLWKRGNRKAVIDLEELWNQLGKKYTFSLYCAYPDLHFIMNKGVKEKILRSHAAHTDNFAAV